MTFVLLVIIAVAVLGLFWLVWRSQNRTSNSGAFEARAIEAETALKLQREQTQHAQTQITALQQQLVSESERRVKAETQFTEAARSFDEQYRIVQEAEKRLKESFDALSRKALTENNEEFLLLAKQSLEKVLVESKGDLGQRHEAIRGLVDPLAKSLQELSAQVGELEQSRAKDRGELSAHLSALASATGSINQQTENLVTALRAPHVRGQWGEMTLRRVVELAGMSDHCDFAEQVSTGSAEEGRLRPDLLIHLPSGREIVVDAKTSLNAYLTAVEASNEADRERALKLHAEQLRTHLKELASKDYWNQFQHSPEFVVMFIPGESFFSAALKYDKALLEDGMANRVVLASPATLIALLKAVAYGWRHEQFTKGAQVVADLGKEVYARFSIYVEHVERLGKSLAQSVGAFNQMAGSLETRILPGLRRFRELGATGEGELSKVEPIEQLPREIVAREKISTEVGIHDR